MEKHPSFRGHSDDGENGHSQPDFVTQYDDKDVFGHEENNQVDLTMETPHTALTV